MVKKYGLKTYQIRGSNLEFFLQRDPFSKEICLQN